MHCDASQTHPGKNPRRRSKAQPVGSIAFHEWLDARERAKKAKEKALAQMPEAVKKQKAAEKRILRHAKANGNLVRKFGPLEMACVGYEVFRNDVKVKWKPICEPNEEPPPARGVVCERSAKTRRALSFLVANTPSVIVGMMTLTWPTIARDGRAVKLSLCAFFDSLRRRLKKKIEWLWWLEFQQRGSPHVHVLTCGECHDELGTRVHPKWCKRSAKMVQRVIFTGELAEWVVERWLSAIGEQDNDDARLFNEGGMWEKIREQEGAARYVAKDAWKPHQTTIPKDYQNVGAWWHRSRGFLKPVPLDTFTGNEAIVRQRLKISPDKPLYPVIFNHAKTTPIELRTVRKTAKQARADAREEARILQRQLSLDSTPKRENLVPTSVP
jgi:hypothetical protein